MPEFKVRSRFFAPPPEFDGCFTSFYHLDLTVEDGGTICDHLQPEWAGIRFMAGSRPLAQLGETSVERPRFAASGPRPQFLAHLFRDRLHPAVGRWIHAAWLVQIEDPCEPNM